MNSIIFISFICTILFSLAFSFPKYFLAKFGYKGNYHPEDIDTKDTVLFYIIFGIFMAASWIILFMSLSELSV